MRCEKSRYGRNRGESLSIFEGISVSMIRSVVYGVYLGDEFKERINLREAFTYL